MTNKNNYPPRRSFLKKSAMASAGLILACSESSALNDKRKRKQGHTIMSCNIRVALPADEEKGTGWNVRKEICAKVIRSHNPDIICLQEVLKVQADDMQHFFPEYGCFGFEGPEMDKYDTGYHGIAKNMIMYSKERYEIVSGGTYWLSEYPLIAGSMSWDTARARHANWIRVRETGSGKEFRVINTHLDHVSEKARMEQIKLILEESAQYQPYFPQVLAGDFNTGPESKVLEMVKEKGWFDAHTPFITPAEPLFSYHAFKGEKYKGKTQGDMTNNRIDFIHTHGSLTVTDSTLVTDNVNGQYPSDHFFVATQIDLQ